MNTIELAAAAVTGARHVRAGRNGQDAAAAWRGDGRAAIVVCDGCGSGPSSEVGARLGAELVVAAIAARLDAGREPSEAAMWAEVRAEVCALLARVADAMACGRESAVHDHLLFTVVAAAVSARQAAVWAIGDGAYAIGTETRVLGPFDDNRPPYLAYDLLGSPHEAHFQVIDAERQGTVLVATDGVAEVGLSAVSVERALRHPDGLRRQLALLARGREVIDWDARRVTRRPAAMQDDGAVAILRWA